MAGETDNCMPVEANLRTGRPTSAITHGLTAKAVLDCEEREYLETVEKLQRTFPCQTVIEEAWLRRIARLIVRLDRAARIDAACFAECFGAVSDERGMSALRFEHFVATVAKYEIAIGRALAKAQHEFERLQSAARGEKAAAPVMVDFTW